MSIRAYPPVKTLEKRFGDASANAQGVDFFYLIESEAESRTLRRQLESAAQRGGAALRFFARIDQLFVGEGDQPWTHAALIRFSRVKAAIAAAGEKKLQLDAERIAVYPIRENLPPPVVQTLAGALRVVGKLVDTGDAGLARPMLGGQRPEVVPTSEQIAARASDTRECPVYCINFLSYRENAQYVDGRPNTLAGVKAYLRYGLRALPAVRALGGRILFGGRAGEPLVDAADSAMAGVWHDIVIVRYPTPRTILKLPRIPWYDGGRVHRDAGLEKTALLVASEAD